MYRLYFFPQGDPNQVYVYLKLPMGTDVEYTDSVTRTLEEKVYKVLGMENGKQNPIVESVISNVAVGAADPRAATEVHALNWAGYRFHLLNLKNAMAESTAPYLDSYGMW